VRLLLRLFPPRFRERFGPDLAEAFDDRVSAARRRGRMRAAAVWARASADLATHGLAERRRARTTTDSGGSLLVAFDSFMAAWRGIRRRPLFSAGIALMLALGLGFNTALYAVVESALLRPLPYADPPRLVFVWHGFAPDGTGFVNSYPDFTELQARSRTLGPIAAYNISWATLRDADTPEQVNGAVVTPDFFAVLGRPAAVGRPLQPGDEAITEARPIVIAYSLWTRRFGRDPGIVDRLITLNDRPRRVVGVMPADFTHPEPFWRETTEYWSPMTVSADMRAARGMRYLRMIARVRAEASLDQARSEVDAVGAALQTEFGEALVPRRPVLRTAFDELVGHTRPLLALFFGASLLVLLLAAANIVNLLLARANGRRQELSVRAALGAGRGRLASQIVLESLILGVAGGALGLVIARLALDVVLSTGAGVIERLDAARLDGSVLAFSLGLSVLTGLVCGAMPAVRVARARLSGQLASSRGSTGLETTRARRWLVAGEMALAVPLLIGAVLLATTLVNLMRVDPGFQPDRALHFRVTLPSGGGQRYETSAARVAFVRDLTERLLAAPGTWAAGVVSSLPMGGLNNTGGSVTYELPDGTTAETFTGFRAASSGYFDALGIPLRRGRVFTNEIEDAQTAVINERLARTLWGEADPIGRRLRLGGTADTGAALSSPWRTVVGVVGDVRHVGLTADADPEMFYPYQSEPWTTISVVVSLANPRTLLPSVETIVGAVDPGLPVTRKAVVADIIAETRRTSTFSAASGAMFGALGVVLAAFGTFAVLSLVVTQRTREIGIRLAIGASPGSIGRLVVRDSLVPALIGCGAGTLVALWAARALSARLFGVDATDPRVFGGVLAAMLAIVVMASWVPARRAMRVDPTHTLRADA
jgi:predicted permease